MTSWIDGTLYPDAEIPEEVTSLEDRIDFLSRFCSSWDFGVLPEIETVTEIRRGEWRDAADTCRLPPANVAKLPPRP